MKSGCLVDNSYLKEALFKTEAMLRFDILLFKYDILQIHVIKSSLKLVNLTMPRAVPTSNPRILYATLILVNSKNFPKPQSVLSIAKNRGRIPEVLEYLSMMAFNI